MPMLTSGPSRFIGGSRVPPDPVPVAGAELLTNGGFESWASATDANNWTEFVSGSNTTNREASDVYAGAYAARMDIDALSSASFLAQSLTHASGVWLRVSAALKSNTASRFALLRLDGTVDIDFQHALTSNYAVALMTARAAQANYTFQIWRVLASSFSVFVDETSVVTLALSSLLSTRLYASANCDLSAAITRTAGTQAGFAARVDDPANPANFIVAYLDGAGNVKVDKCVAGTYTNVISGAVTYVAGQTLRLVCSGNSVSAYYNGTQVGSTVTVSDAGIVSNTRHGKFSTYASNTLANYVAA